MDKWYVTCSYNITGAFIVVANLCGGAVVVLQIIGVVQSWPRAVGPPSRAGFLVNSLGALTQLYGLAQVFHHMQDQHSMQL